MMTGKRKTFNVSDEFHYKVDVEAAVTKRSHYEVLQEAWELYERNKIGSTPPPMGAEARLIAKFLNFWRKPEGMEIPLRKMLATIFDEPEPPSP